MDGTSGLSPAPLQADSLHAPHTKVGYLIEAFKLLGKYVLGLGFYLSFLFLILLKLT